MKKILSAVVLAFAVVTLAACGTPTAGTEPIPGGRQSTDELPAGTQLSMPEQKALLQEEFDVVEDCKPGWQLRMVIAATDHAEGAAYGDAYCYLMPSPLEPDTRVIYMTGETAGTEANLGADFIMGDDELVYAAVDPWDALPSCSAHEVTDARLADHWKDPDTRAVPDTPLAVGDLLCVNLWIKDVKDIGEVFLVDPVSRTIAAGPYWATHAAIRDLTADIYRFPLPESWD